MDNLETQVELCIKEINALHDAVARTNWAEINRQGFVFELEQNTKRIKDIYAKLETANKEVKMLLEKNSPNIDSFLSEMVRELTVLEANLSMEKKKKLRTELVNEKENTEVPELYSSIQQKMLSLSLKARYNADKIRTFIIARKTPFMKKGTTAKNLLEVLQKKEEELNELKQKNIELKRKTFFGLAPEKGIAEIESELHELDKKLSESVLETKKSLKTHLAQINYVEGSFIGLKTKVEEIENMHAGFAHKSIEMIKELKKERDFAKTLALEIEQETLHTRSEYTRQLIGLEEKKQNIEEHLKEKYERELASLKRQIDEKNISLKHATRLCEQLEEEIKKLKGN